MNNANFASYLQKALEAGKLNKAKFTQDFINQHHVEGTKPSIEVETEETKSYARTFIQKRAVSTDADFKAIMSELATKDMTAPEAVVPAHRTPRGEY